MKYSLGTILGAILQLILSTPNIEENANESEQDHEALASSLSDYFLLQYDIDAMYRKWATHQAYEAFIRLIVVSI
jgi:hypothetical protein